MNFEQARYNMIEQQIRTWEVLDPQVIDLLYAVKREEFVPQAYRLQAFTDTEIPLGHGACMLPPKLEAHALQALRLKGTERVLEIGTGSGHMAALLAAHASQVWTIECVAELAASASTTLQRLGIDNVEVIHADGARGWTLQSPYDAIMVSGGLPGVPQELLAQLAIGGRLLVFVGETPLYQAQLITRQDERNYTTTVLFETQVPALQTNELAPTLRFRF